MDSNEQEHSEFLLYSFEGKSISSQVKLTNFRTHGSAKIIFERQDPRFQDNTQPKQRDFFKKN